MTIIKICGIRTLTDALAAIEAGADYLGFNFYRQSPRYIAPQDCAAITALLKKEHPEARLVGVYVNSSEAEINAIMESCSLDLAQLHGDESAAFRASVGERAFKALRGAPNGAVESFARAAAPAFLLDAAHKGAYGGTGTTTDWAAAAVLAKRYPLFLAGGLNPENVGAAVRQVRPWGVDVASGVESSPGEKDAGKMRTFVAAVRSAAIAMENS
ncbi:MAG TPA: phosphoribosylanthranilate isomerase [Anaerolineales bacterium]|jgi:phosphoribosylanthranilate isomerase